MQMARIESTGRRCQATRIDLNIVASERPHHLTGMRKKVKFKDSRKQLNIKNMIFINRTGTTFYLNISSHAQSKFLWGGGGGGRCSSLN